MFNPSIKVISGGYDQNVFEKISSYKLKSLSPPPLLKTHALHRDTVILGVLKQKNLENSFERYSDAVKIFGLN